MEPLTFLAIKVLIKDSTNIPFVVSLCSFEINNYLHKILSRDNQVKYLNAIKKWTNGILTEYIDFKNNRLHGLYMVRYANGNLMQENYFANGLRCGIHKYWYESGIVQLVKGYKDGKQHGIHESYYLDGAISETINYVDDKRIGRCINYLPNGNVVKISHFKNGLLHGKYTKWTTQLKHECYYVDGMLHGEYIIYEQDQIKTHQCYLHNVKVKDYLLENDD